MRPPNDTTSPDAHHGPRPGPLGPRTVWTALEAAFTIVLVLATTLGPVYQLRVRLGPVKGAFSDDAVVIAIFGVLYAGAATLAARSSRRVDPLPVSLVVGMTSLLVISTLWSIDRPLTAMHSLTALGTLTIPWYLTRRWDTKEITVLTWLATSIGVAFSAVAVLRHWNGSVDRREDWAGIYFNRNSLGPVAGLCLLLALWILIRGVTRTARRVDVAVRLLAAASVPVAGLLLARSGSKTSLLSTVAAGVVTAAIVVAVSVGRGRIRKWHLGAALTVLALAPLLVFSRITSMMGATPTLEGRTTLWGYLWDKFWESPMTGKGWLATYSSLEYWHWGVEHLSTNVYSAHNGIIEVAVGAGAVAFVALVLVLWMGVDRSLDGTLGKPLDEAPLLIFMTFFLVENMGETFVGSNHFLWILFLSTCALRWQPGRRGRRHSAASASASASDG